MSKNIYTSASHSSTIMLSFHSLVVLYVIVSCIFFFIIIWIIVKQENQNLPKFVLKANTTFENQEVDTSIAKYSSGKKVLLLWTTYQNRFEHWEWFLRKGPFVSNCKNLDVSHRCLITRSRKLTKYADVILFSLQDLKKVTFACIKSISRTKFKCSQDSE